LEKQFPFPPIGVAETAEEALAAFRQVDFPLLVRPSYVWVEQGINW